MIINVGLGQSGVETPAVLGKAFLSITPDARDRYSPAMPGGRDFANLTSRLARYAIGEALYENTAYEDIHTWAKQVRVDYKLSPDVVNIYNPTRKAVDFWSSHLYPGSVDEEAGDGKATPSAIPILTRSDAVRTPLARIFEDSQINANIRLFPRLGAMCGDVGVYAVNDRYNRRTYLEFIHPRSIVEYIADPTGIPEYYAIEEWWDDPRPAKRSVFKVIRREEGRLLRDGTGQPVACEFRTFIVEGGKKTPFAWEMDERPVWVEDYPFVPLVVVPHIKVDQRIPFGQFEVSTLWPKIAKLDDLASRFALSVGKTVDPVWLFAGVKPSELEQILGGDIPSLAAGDNARAQALVSSLDLAAVNAKLKMLLEELKDELPEIRKDIEHATGDSSGTALRVAQQRIETKAQTRRAAYDHALVAALKMCVRMGGIEDYDGYEGFDPDTLAASPDRLRFKIGKRPVFEVSRIDELAIEEKELANMESADRAGIPAPAWIEISGKKEWLPIVLRERDKALEQGLPVGRAKQASPVNEPAAQAAQAPGGTAP